MIPVSSAMGMKSSGATRPTPGRSQRTSASKPRIWPVFGVDDRLTEQPQFVAADCLAEGGFEFGLTGDPLLHGVVEQFVAASPVLFGAVHREVSIRDDHVWFVGPVYRQGDADTCADLRVVIAELERCLQGVDDALGEIGHVKGRFRCLRRTRRTRRHRGVRRCRFRARCFGSGHRPR